jgi:hypothetical protein
MQLAGILVAICVVLGMLFPRFVIVLLETVPWQESRRPQLARAVLLLALAAAATIWMFAFAE